jgi:hypothetical protein
VKVDLPEVAHCLLPESLKPGGQVLRELRVLNWHQGSPGIAMGSVVRSNVANLGLILGCCALIMPSA